MSRTILIKIKKAGSLTGPFNVFDSLGNLLDENVSKSTLVAGKTYVVSNDALFIKIVSIGNCINECNSEIVVNITQVYQSSISSVKYVIYNTASSWRHLTNPVIYNYYYNKIQPYIIEYPFAYQYHDEILQNVKDYTKAYNYLPSVKGVWDDNRKIEVDNQWFNKAILYNGQQCSGILELAPKPKNNMSEYMKYPIYGTSSKTITYTKSDNFYQYNTFWSLVKDKTKPLFEVDCCYALSLDKIVNQSNMDYGKRSFKKEPLRAKDLKVRHILDNRFDLHLTSQFIIAPSQISYK